MNSFFERSGGRLASLDTLRGVAIVMVVAFHVATAFAPVAWLFQLVKLGNQGVQLFFLISAITMCFMWEQRAAEPQRQIRFYIRRFFRIAPLFWAAICFYLLWWHLTSAVSRPPELPGLAQVALTALFLHGFSPSAINLVVPGGWSIAVEMTFYAMFPLLAAYRATPVQTLAFAFTSYLLLGVCATPLVEHHFSPDPLFVYYSMLTEFPIFPVGMFVYAVAMRGDDFDARGVATVAVSWLGAAFAGKYLFELNTRPFFWLQVALFALAIWAVIRHGLHLRILSVLGTLSYSMYLLHFAVIDVFAMLAPLGWREGTAAYVSFLALVLVVTTAAAKISSVTIEKWSSELARAVIARIGPPVRRPVPAE